jgi:hypothetical protein
MNITPRMIESAYEFLRATPPFSGWRLPHADEVEFRVSRHRDRLAHFVEGREGPIIAVSSVNVTYPETLLRVMAHEMVHLAQWLHKTETPGAEHNAEFFRMAAKVAKAHGFDI